MFNATCVKVIYVFYNNLLYNSYQKWRNELFWPYYTKTLTTVLHLSKKMCLQNEPYVNVII